MRRTRVLKVAVLVATGILCGSIRAFTQMPVFAPTATLSTGTIAVLQGLSVSLVGDVNSALRTAVRDAHDHPEALYSAWRVARDYPSTASAALRAGEPEYVTLALARAGSDREQRGKLVAAAADAAEANADLDLLAEALLAVTNKYGGMPALTVFAFGDIRGAVTGPDPRPGVGTGALGLTIRNSWAIWQALLNVAATTDTLKSAFGAAVLSPTGGKPLSSGSLSFRTNSPLSGGTSGPHLHVYGSLARYTWRDSTLINEVPTLTALDASVFGAGALLWHELGCCHIGTNSVSLAAEYGVALRWVDGDVSNAADFRTRTLGTTTTFFPGIEAGTQLGFGRVIGTLQAYYLASGKVNGLSHLQVIGSFSIAGDVFSGVIDR